MGDDDPSVVQEIFQRTLHIMNGANLTLAAHLPFPWNLCSSSSGSMNTLTVAGRDCGTSTAVLSTRGDELLFQECLRRWARKCGPGSFGKTNHTFGQQQKDAGNQLKKHLILNVSKKTKS